MKHPREKALRVARELVNALLPATERIIVAGSLRRKCQEVGDVEILYIPKTSVRPWRQGDLFQVSREAYSLADDVLQTLMDADVLTQRRNTAGFKIWGAKNKLALHVRSGIPVDLFAATEENCNNYLVCRTVAQSRGLKWHPYGPGFTRGSEWLPVASEEEVFRMVGLTYHPPELR